MKIKISAILTALSLMNLCCSGIQITGNNVKKELHASREYIKKDKANIYKLDNKIIGKKGYFYIIRSNGTLSYHPKKALINVDFSGYPFVQKVLKDRNGCIAFNADGIPRFIFFTEIDSDEILCLTIESSEFDETVIDCN